MNFTVADIDDVLNAVRTFWNVTGPFIMSVIKAIIIWLIGREAIKYIVKFLAKTFERTKVDVGVSKFLQSLVNIILQAILILMIIRLFGVDTTGLIAVLGTLGLTVGLALQGSLSNFAGGVLLLLFRPFKVGDYIVEDGHKNEGTVLAIDILYTKLLTVDNKVVYIPNGTMANTSLTNVTAEKVRRLDLNVGISYDSDLRKAKEILSGIVNSNEKILADKAKDVFVKSLDESAVTLEARVWVNGSDYWDVKWALLEEFKLEFDKAGIQIPYNQIDVNLKNNQ